MNCSRCAGESVFQVVESDETIRLCAVCLDRLYPNLRLGNLTRWFAHKREGGACPYCGWTTQKAKDAGLVGCPLCYEALDRSLWSEFGIHLVAP